MEVAKKSLPELPWYEYTKRSGADLVICLRNVPKQQTILYEHVGIDFAAVTDVRIVKPIYVFSHPATKSVFALRREYVFPVNQSWRTLSPSTAAARAGASSSEGAANGAREYASATWFCELFLCSMEK